MRAFLLTVLIISSLLINAQKDTMLVNLSKELGLPERSEAFIDAANSKAWKLQRLDPVRSMRILLATYNLAQELGYEKGRGKSLSHQSTLKHNDGKYDQAIQGYKRALLIFEQLESTNEIAKCFSKAGESFYLKGDLDSATLYYNSSLQHFTNPIGIGAVHNNLALTEQRKGNYGRAIEHHISSAEIFDSLNLQSMVGTSYLNIGTLYNLQKDWAKADEYLKRSISIGIATKDEDLVHRSLANRATILSKQGKPDSALFYNKKCMEYYVDNGLRALEANTLNNMASNYSDLDSSKQAKECYIKSYQIYQELEMSDKQASVLSNLGALHQDQSNLDSAKWYMEKAFAMADTSGKLHIVAATAKNLTQIYNELNDLENAYKFQSIYSQINDSLLRAEKSMVEGEVEAKYDNRIKKEIIQEQERNLRNKSAVIFWVVIGLICIVLFALVLYYYLRRSRQEVEKLDEEKTFIELEKNELSSILNEKEALLEKLQERAVYKQKTLPPHFSKLSKREVEVLLLLGEGIADKEIAERLFVSVTTVRTHLRKIYSKLLITNRVEAVNVVHKYDMHSLQS